MQTACVLKAINSVWQVANRLQFPNRRAAALGDKLMHGGTYIPLALICPVR